MSDPFGDAIAIVVDERIRNARTVVVGKVDQVTLADDRKREVTFDAGVGTRRAGGVSSDGSAPDAPVLYPGGGGCSMVWPLVAGDEAVAVVSDRPVQLWRQTKEVGEAPAFGDRHHNLSDALVMPVAMTAADGAPLDVGSDFVLTGPTSGAVVIRSNGATVATITVSNDGNVLIDVADGKTVKIGDSGAEALVKVAALETEISALLAAGAGVVPNPMVGTNGILAFTAADGRWSARASIGTTKALGS